MQPDGILEAIASFPDTLLQTALVTDYERYDAIAAEWVEGAMKHHQDIVKGLSKLCRRSSPCYCEIVMFSWSLTDFLVEVSFMR